MAGFVLALLLSAGLVALILLLSRPSPLIRSVAVLPLENLSGDASQDYFSDGMTEELITELGQIGELCLVARHHDNGLVEISLKKRSCPLRGHSGKTPPLFEIRHFPPLFRKARIWIWQVTIPPAPAFPR
jgi:hypothetical protein